MKTEQDIRNRIKELEDSICLRIKQGHPQVKLVDASELRTLNWVLEDYEKFAN